MKKLKLRMDDLRVESFETIAGNGGARGTVPGNEPSVMCSNTCTANADCTNDFACETYGDCTLAGSCEGTCGNSCDATCQVSCYGTCDATCNSCFETDCGCYTLPVCP
jgi:hypothetical protein